MTPEAIALCLTYWVNVFLWSGLGTVFGRKYIRAKKTTPTVKSAIVSLTIVCFVRGLVDFYYAVLINARYGALPNVFYVIMSRPQLWMIPKIATLLSGFYLLWLILKILKRER